MFNPFLPLNLLYFCSSDRCCVILMIVSEFQIITPRKHCDKTNEIFTLRSPDMFAPARIPVAAGKKMEYTEKKLC